MTTIEARVSTQTKRRQPVTPAKSKNPNLTEPPSLKHAGANKASDDPRVTRITKHDRILELLRRQDGATIPEMMAATGWQQHSVRGFLAGTVKTKLGLNLTSSKPEGEFRRYRIVTRRGR